MNVGIEINNQSCILTEEETLIYYLVSREKMDPEQGVFLHDEEGCFGRLLEFVRNNDYESTLLGESDEYHIEEVENIALTL